MVHCAYHPRREAVGACVECGRLICARCHTEHDGKGYCQPCAQNLFGLQSITSDETKAAAPSPPRPKTTKISRAKPSKAVASIELEATIKKEEPETEVTKTPSEPQAPSPRKVSNLWWLAPVFLSLLGGLVAWLLNKKADPRKSKHMLFGGIGMTFVQGIVALVVVFALCVPRVPGPGQGQSTASSIPSSIHTVVVGPDIPSAPEPPEFILKPLVTKTVKSSAQDQIVTGDSKLTVLIPGGTLKNNQGLKISSVQNPPPLTEGLDYIAVYDITFSKDHEFEKELTFSLTYDSPEPSQQPLSDADVAAAYWNEADGSWMGIPVSIDTQSGVTKLVVQTSHNGYWAWFKRKVGLPLTEEDEALFIIYPPSALPTDKQKADSVTSELKDKRQSNKDIRKELEELDEKLTMSKLSHEEREDTEARVSDLSSELRQLKAEVEELIKQVAAFSGMDLYSARYPAADYLVRNPFEHPIVTDLGESLRLAYRAYKPDEDDNSSNNFRMPATPIEVYLVRSTSNYSKVYKWINIDMTLNGDWLSMRNTAAHELFHAVQNQYYYAAGQNLLRNWWLESTAEYAATKLVRQGDFFPEIIAGEWMATPFYSCEDEHAKRNCYFLDWVIRQHNLNFKTMFESVASAYFTAAAFEEYLSKQTGLSMPDLYRNFVEYLLFDSKSPYKDKLDCENRPTDRKDALYGFSSKDKLISKYVGICPEVAEAERKFNVSMYFAYQCDKVRVDIYKVENNERGLDNVELIGTFGGFSGEPFDKGASVDVTVEKGGGLYLLVTQAGLPEFGEGTSSELKVRVKDIPIPKLSLESNLPPSEKGLVCTDYNFTAKHSDLPPRAKLVWYVDGQEVKGESDSFTHKFSSHGSHVVKVRAIWPEPSERGELWERIEAEITCDVGKPELTILPQPVVKPITNTPYDFLVEPHYIPDVAEYKWYVKGVEEDSSQIMTTEFSQAGTYPITVKAQWNYQGCAGNTEATIQFTVEAPSVSIIVTPDPGKAGKVSSFGVSGTPISEGTRFYWEFGEKNAAGNLTSLSQEPVPHTYEKIGFYTVTVTLIDSSGKALASDTIVYQVVAPELPVSLSIQAPISPLNPDIQNTFAAVPTNIPTNALYTWYLDERQALQGIDKITVIAPAKSLQPGKHQLNLIVNWVGTDNKNKQAAASTSFIVGTPTPTPTPTGPPVTAHQHPIVNGISGPSGPIIGPGPYKFSINVSGGKPPYNIEWRGNNVIYSGTGNETVNILRDQMRWGGTPVGYFVFITVKDSAGEYAVWLDNDGIPKYEFDYGAADRGGFVTAPRTFPYRVPSGK